MVFCREPLLSYKLYLCYFRSTKGETLWSTWGHSGTSNDWGIPEEFSVSLCDRKLCSFMCHEKNTRFKTLLSGGMWFSSGFFLYRKSTGNNVTFESHVQKIEPSNKLTLTACHMVMTAVKWIYCPIIRLMKRLYQVFDFPVCLLTLGLVVSSNQNYCNLLFENELICV